MATRQKQKQSKTAKNERVQRRMIESMTEERRVEFFDRVAQLKAMPRREEVKKLKVWIDELLKEFEISKTFYTRNVSKVRGEGFSFVFGADKFDGHKASLRQRFAMLMQLADSARRNKEAMASAIKEIEEKKALKEKEMVNV